MTKIAAQQDRLNSGTTARSRAVVPEALSLVSDRWLSERLMMAAFTLSATADPNCEPDNGPAFIQAKVDIANAPRTEALVRTGYMLVETAVTLAMDIDRLRSGGTNVRFAQPADEPLVRQTAGSAFIHSRFHMDPLIPASIANQIKSDWAGNFFAGARGTHMIVAQDNDLVIGFLLLIARGDDLIIDLVGVTPRAQGRGFGQAMLDFAAGHVEGPRRFVVGTQLRNTPSLAYYNKQGFRITSANYSLHRHIR